MSHAVDFLGSHWLALAVILLGLGCWLVPAVLGRRALWAFSGLLAPVVLIGFGLGAFLEFDTAWGASWQLAGFVFAGLVAILTTLVLIVALTGFWSAPLGYALGAGIVISLGAFACQTVQRFLETSSSFLISLRPLSPWWLVLLLAIPALILLSFRSLAGLGPARRAIAIGLRSLLVLLIVLALAETHAQRPNENLTVLFLWDRSLSIPQEFPQEFDPVRQVRDLREERIKAFINDAVAQRGGRKKADRVGVIVFGRRPRLELPPAAVDKLGFHKVVSVIDDTYTDLSAAMKLALASFPEGTARRIVLISDGNENLGQVEEQARIAKQNGVEIDIVPIAAGRRNVNEVLVERVEAPSATEKDARLPIRIVLRSHHPDVVVGNLTLTKISLDLKKSDKDGLEHPTFEAQPVLETTVKLNQGLNVFFFQQPGSKKEEAYTYEAKFVPQHVESARGKILHGKLAGDRIENNRASVTVMARGQQSLLLLEPNAGDHKLLVERLLKAKPSLKIVATEPTRLPDPAALAVVLSKFDGVILANVPADSLTEEQQRVLRGNVHDQGCGLIMIGGHQSFGAGGWQGTEIEKALPVLCDLKAAKVEGKGGLVLMMHASEMAEGNAWQRKVAKLAIEKLSPMDMVGMLYYDYGQRGGGHQWHIPFQQVGQGRQGILQQVDTMNPGDMPDCDPAFEKALAELTRPAYSLAVKHIIFISDGDHWNAGNAVINKLRAAKVTVTTVCITTHGQAEIVKMKALADACAQIDDQGKRRGNAYHIEKPHELPAIYIKESRVVSQSFVHELPDGFQPKLVGRSGPTEGFKDLEALYGYVRTTKRPSPLVDVPIETPVFKDKNKFPILATWQYGLGKAAAFTSDARTQPEGKAFWDRDWANSQTHGKFWEQMLDWALRPGESGKFLHLTTEHKDGKVRVIVEALDADKKPITEVEFKAGISSPSFKESAGRKELRFDQKNSGVYEAEFPAEEVGSYFINLQAKWKDAKTGQIITDGVRSGVTIPYSPEFAEMESNTALLERLRDITGGKAYTDDAQALAEVARSGELFRAAIGHYSLLPLWYWLVLLAGICLAFDVAVRRISISPLAASYAAIALWTRLRRQAAAEQPREFMDRLKSRKAQVATGLAARRFEAPEGTAPIAPEMATPASTGPTTPPQAAPAKLAPETEREAQDFASRLLRAKKKAMDEREKK